MSMVIYLRRASEADVARIGEDGEAADRFVFEEGDPEQNLVDFDVAWDVLHFLLCGTAQRDAGHPLSIIACQLPELGLEANGFGGFSVIPPETVRRFAEALEALPDDELMRRFNTGAWASADLYFGDVLAEDARENGPEVRAFVFQRVPALRRLVMKCAANGDALIRVLR